MQPDKSLYCATGNLETRVRMLLRRYPHIYFSFLTCFTISIEMQWDVLAACGYTMIFLQFSLKTQFYDTLWISLADKALPRWDHILKEIIWGSNAFLQELTLTNLEMRQNWKWQSCFPWKSTHLSCTSSIYVVVVVVVVLLFYVHGKHLRSCRDGQLT